MIQRISGQVRLALRNSVRNVRRSMLTAITVLVGTSLTVVALAFMTGLYDQIMIDYAENQGHGRVVTAAFEKREMLQPLYENIADVDPVLDTVRAIPGVTDAYPVIRLGVSTAVGEEIGETFANVTGAPLEWYESHVKPRAIVLDGAWLSESKDAQVVLGRRAANDAGAKVGDSILLLGATQYGSMSPVNAKVVGVITGDSTLDTQAFVTLDTARWMADMESGALQVMFYTDSFEPSVAEPVALAVQGALGDTYVVSSWSQQGAWPGTMPVINGMEYIIAGLMIFVMVLAIFNTMSMSVMERTSEIGVMRAMGQSRIGAVSTFLIEAGLIGAVGGVLGVLIGGLFAAYLATQGVSLGQDMVDQAGEGAFPIKSTYYAVISVQTLLYCLGVGVAAAIAGAAMPAIRAASIRPTHAMRARR
ncbi:MAG: ABC transporter permease [Myxococcota bacterium]